MSTLTDLLPQFVTVGPPVPAILAPSLPFGGYWPWTILTRPVPEYKCPYGDNLEFITLQELQEHVKTAHDGERIPIQITWD